MKVTTEKIENQQVVLTIEVAKEDVKKAIDQHMLTWVKK